MKKGYTIDSCTVAFRLFATWREKRSWTQGDGERAFVKKTMKKRKHRTKTKKVQPPETYTLQALFLSSVAITL